MLTYKVTIASGPRHTSCGIASWTHLADIVLAVCVCSNSLHKPAGWRQVSLAAVATQQESKGYCSELNTKAAKR